MELDVREAARLLKVSAQAIYRLIHREQLPARGRGDRYQFDRVELVEWSKQRHAAAVAPRSGGPPSLRDALHHGGIHHGIQANDRDTALRALAQLPGNRVALSPTALFEMLLAREQLAATTVGGGVALPHPRDPTISGVELEYVHLCFFANPIDFGALDHRPVHAALLLLSPNIEAHLQLLARVALTLRDTEFRRLLAARADENAIRSRLDAVLGLVESRNRSARSGA